MDSEATLDALRQRAQLDFEASGAPLEFGSLAGLPFSHEELLGSEGVQRFDSGLTAEVIRLRAVGRDWTLKRARRPARVQNVDGQTSFLNEVQRRIDFAALKAVAPEGWEGLVDTVFADYRAGLLLSPWIEGETVRQWDERRIRQLLTLACRLWAEGFFEWDLCPGNVLDDGERLCLFDFGYCYRFDPLRQFSSAGRGLETRFHPAERFETRNFSGWLLDQAEPLAAFRAEKAIALEVYEDLLREMTARGASAEVLGWLGGLCRGWEQGLRGDAATLFTTEMWRSHALDLDDDLRGRTCTRATLRRADWLLGALRRDFGALCEADALFGADAGVTREALLVRYAAHRTEAERWQTGA